MGDTTQDLTTMPNGDVYAHGHPIAPGSHMPSHNPTNNTTSNNDRRRSDDPTPQRREEDRETSLPYQGGQSLQGASKGKKLEIFRRSVTSTNVGYANGLGHRMGAGVGTPLSFMIAELKSTKPSVASVQEHKLGKYDFVRLPGLPEDFEWDWLGFPGHNRHSQGLGFCSIDMTDLMTVK
jgi:hypothetical protein